MCRIDNTTLSTLERLCLLFSFLFFFLLAIVLSVLFRFTHSDHSFGIFKHFLYGCVLHELGKYLFRSLLSTFDQSQKSFLIKWKYTKCIVYLSDVKWLLFLYIKVGETRRSIKNADSRDIGNTRHRTKTNKSKQNKQTKNLKQTRRRNAWVGSTWLAPWEKEIFVMHYIHSTFMKHTNEKKLIAYFRRCAISMSFPVGKTIKGSGSRKSIHINNFAD
jgi:hypothetical protein